MNILTSIKDWYNDVVEWYKMKKYYRQRGRAFEKSKLLAVLKHRQDGKRYYVFEDKWGGYTVLNNRQINRVYNKTGVKFEFYDAIYKTK